MNNLKFGDKVTVIAIDDLPEEVVTFIEDAGNGCFIAETEHGGTDEIPYGQIKFLVEYARV